MKALYDFAGPLLGLGAEPEDLRLDAEVEDLSKIRRARVERSGDISFIKD